MKDTDAMIRIACHKLPDGKTPRLEGKQKQNDSDELSMNLSGVTPGLSRKGPTLVLWILNFFPVQRVLLLGTGP